MILASVRATAKAGKQGELQQRLQAACRQTKGFPGYERFLRSPSASSLLFVAKWAGRNPWEGPRNEAEEKVLAELLELLRTVTPLCERAEIELQTDKGTGRSGTAGPASEKPSSGLSAVDGLWGPPDDSRLENDRGAEDTVRRAEGYIQGHLGEELAVSDLAAAAGVSVRTLFRKFRSLGRGSPMKVLEVARLEDVRRRLLEGGPGDTVTRLATDAGFAHLSRFSGLYKKTYGEPPSETLRRARRSHSGDPFRGLGSNRAGTVEPSQVSVRQQEAS